MSANRCPLAGAFAWSRWSTPAGDACSRVALSPGRPVTEGCPSRQFCGRWVLVQGSRPVLVAPQARNAPDALVTFWVTPWGKSRKTPRTLEDVWEAFCPQRRGRGNSFSQRLPERWEVAWLMTRAASTMRFGADGDAVTVTNWPHTRADFTAWTALDDST